MTRSPMTQLEDYFRQKVSQEGFDLFAVFARFEYAMKKGGFRRHASPDAAWQSFAGALPGDFYATMQAAPEARVYFDQPPAYLVRDAFDGVEWSKTPVVVKDASSLFEAIKVARNNLFHGDKAHDNDRDTKLMAAALFVLNSAFAATERDPKFQRFVSEMEFGL
ncbi:hypothetical protein [Rhizobium sp. PP-CC-3G-465]|uniref:hypothetical protein n=1 Tax=Rhizobium sp. PP-CC-3G-465 TaxID=2135648 RepID=UPI00104892C8